MVRQHLVPLVLASLLSAGTTPVFAESASSTSTSPAASSPSFTTQRQADAAVAWPGLPPAVQQQLKHGRPHGKVDTTWRRPDGKPWFTNRLALSNSPYLLEHAHNPINWYPWGPAALAAAKAQHKPLFISIGYASCHWCHVMARESFENQDVARLLNRHFIAVKVDRQEHPTLDRRYQTVVAIATNGQTGWPATVLALPDGRPFYANVYQPRADLIATLDRAADLWQTKRPALEHDADTLSRLVAQVLDRHAKAETIKPALFDRAARQLAMDIDPFNGGFGHGNKFPEATRLRFLIDRISRGNTDLKPSVTRTLDGMMRGGIHDQIGGGFFRYATTPDWRVPHFEKMLYDQAQLAALYLRAGMVLNRPDYLAVTRDTLDFVLRDMRAADGGFVAAISADSPHRRGGPNEEGAFYTWTPAQLDKAIRQPADHQLAADYWGIDANGDFDGASVPHRSQSDAAFAQQHGLSSPALDRRLDALRWKLAQTRRMRPHPAVDDNRITAWNGLMIRTLADAGRQLGDQRYLRAATRAGKFLWEHLRTTDEQTIDLARAWRSGHAAGTGTLADYADLALGYLALYDATGKPRWLDHAQQLAAAIETRFKTPGGGYLDHPNMNANDPLAPKLRPYEDDAEPAGNPQVLRLLSGLAARTTSNHYADAADALTATFSGLINQQPLAATGLLDAIAAFRSPAPATQTWAAHGGLQIRTQRKGPDTVRVLLDLKPGWHINAHQTLAKLIPTQVKAVPPLQTATINYPSGRKTRLSFSPEPLPLYVGDKVIRIRLANSPESGSGPVRLNIKFQACNDKVCLAPDTRSLLVGPDGARMKPLR